MTITTNKFIRLFRSHYDGSDPWFSITSWAFALCDFLNDYSIVPEYWGYQCSPLGTDKAGFEYQAIYELCGCLPLQSEDREQLMQFSRFLHVMYKLCKTAGRDY